MPDNLVRAVTDNDSTPSPSPSVTTSGKSVSPKPMSFERFYEHYHAAPDRKWQVEVLERLIALTAMPAGWDSYRAPPVPRDSGFFALEVLNGVMRSRTPVPHVVPSSVGGVQLEWHEKDVDLELHITAPYQCDVWFRDHRTGKTIDEEISNDFSMLNEPIQLLTSR